jgi:hypothetical protein
MKPQSFFIDITDGILKVFTTPVPKEKDYWIESEGFFDSDTYEQALELAKKEAVEINEPYIYQLLMHSYYPEFIDHFKTPQDNFNMYANHDRIYTINMEDEIEVVDGFKDGDTMSDPCRYAKIMPVDDVVKFLRENGIDPKEEAMYGQEQISRLHAIADFCKIFDKFRTNPFKASLMHYLETGTISGNMALAVGQFAEQKRLEGASAIEMANRILKTPDILSPESKPEPDSSSLPKEGDS